MKFAPAEKPERHSHSSTTNKSTTHRTTSSSAYPPSTHGSTASQTEWPPSPQSPSRYDADIEVARFDGDADAPELDGDDVSYRLRLLVKNNYFLPPAHHKPTRSDLSSNSASSSKKASSLFGLFRRSRSKTSSTESSPKLPAISPSALSPTDSPAVDGQTQTRPPPKSSRTSPLTRNRSGRVLVVREQMLDIDAAMKMAELDMKRRELQHNDAKRQMKQPNLDLTDVDPTDVVDVAPPPSNYPFAVQASATHAMGAEVSIGADVLADRLPPQDQKEMEWRRRLLYKAIDHSLSSGSEVDLSSQSSSTHHTLSSTSSVEVNSPETSMLGYQRKFLGKKIMQDVPEEGPIDSHHELRPPFTRKCSGHSDRAKAREALTSPIRRTESPAMTTLAPAPRKGSDNDTINVISENHEVEEERELDEARRPSSQSSHLLRRSSSVPVIADPYDIDGHSFMRSPSPLGAAPADAFSDDEVPRRQTRDTMSSGHSNYTLGPPAGHHKRSSAQRVDGGLDSQRTSKAYSARSSATATTTGFYDAFIDSYRARTPRFSVETSRSAITKDDRPPLPSLSTANIPVSAAGTSGQSLTPPPRTTSLLHSINHGVEVEPSIGQVMSRASSRAASVSSSKHSSPIPKRDDKRESKRESNGTMGKRNIHALTLHVSPDKTPVAIHSAPPPQSPASFFDHVQRDILDSIDSDSENEFDSSDLKVPAGPINPVYHDSRSHAVSNQPHSTQSPARVGFMRFGNHSSPHVARPRDAVPSMPQWSPVHGGPTAKRKSIFNAFAMKKSKSTQAHHGIPVSRSDFVQHAKLGNSHLFPSGSTRSFDQSSASDTRSSENHFTTASSNPPSPYGASSVPPSPKVVDPSVKILDSKLIQHMEAEKAAIKRIATSLASPKP